MEKIITKYVVGDKEFQTKEDATSYLKKIEDEKLKNEKIALEKEKRRKEVEEAYAFYKKLKNKYDKDYPKSVTNKRKITDDDIFNMLFKTIF